MSASNGSCRGEPAKVIKFAFYSIFQMKLSKSFSLSSNIVEKTSDDKMVIQDGVGLELPELHRGKNMLFYRFAICVNCVGCVLYHIDIFIVVE